MLSVLDICRVCRSGPTGRNPLFHPCMCTGSMGFVHQDWYATLVYVLYNILDVLSSVLDVFHELALL